ncbi:MAG: hypothetical protein EPN85_00720 [Bacteroidetes bacterium]|nr:MAG: hypothetical protein EPN85_00720 [Bacteroidota bacterium]
MQLFNVCSKKEYIKDGEKKIKWMRAGLLKITDTGKRFLTFFHLPGIEYHLFEHEPKKEEVIQLDE